MDTIIKIRKFVIKQIIDIKTYGILELFRKLYLISKIFIMIPVYFFAIVPCIIIRLISPWIIIRIDKFPTGNFGDLIERPSEYHIRKKFKINLPKKKFLDLVYIDYKNKVYNKQLVKMWKRQFNFLSGYFLDPISRVNKLMPKNQIHSIEVLTTSKMGKDVDNLIEKYQPLNFTNEEEIFGKKMLNEIGLKDKDKFICLIVRDTAYQKKKIPTRYRDWSYHDHRNEDVNNYLLAAEELAKRGYYVFRMGAAVEKAFTSSSDKIIDYANSNYRSDFMDVYLGTKCFFCISTGLGFDFLAYYSRKPIVYTNIAPVGDLHTMSAKHMHLTKHHIFKKEKRKLSLSEIFSHGVGFAFNSKIYKEKGIGLVGNTPEEIRDLVIEMVEHLEFNKKLDKEDEELQKSFKNLYISNIKQYSKNQVLIRDPMHGIIRSRFSTKFLRENRNWLR